MRSTPRLAAMAVMAMARGRIKTVNSPASFRSTTGPRRRNANSAPGVTCAANPKARKASTLEHTDTTTASSIKAKIDPVGAPPTASNQLRGSQVWTSAAIRHPSTRRARRSKNSRLLWSSTSDARRRVGSAGAISPTGSPIRPPLRSSSPILLRGWLILRSLSRACSSNWVSGSWTSRKLSETAITNAPKGRATSSQG